MGFPFMKGTYTPEELTEFTDALEVLAEGFNENSSEVNVFIFTASGVQKAFTGDILNDLVLI